MQVGSLIGRKIDQTQGFLENGMRVPLSIISVGANVVSQTKHVDKEGYNAVQLSLNTTKKTTKKITKPIAGHLKKAGLEKSPRFFREIRVDEVPMLESGATISVAEVFEPGDIVDITGTSKGKGYAGVVKRHGFAGGPRTHGQSDRERAPGSIGQTTTPGRVYRGKRMAGRMGNEKVTIKNLEILDVSENAVLVRGLIPGIKGSIVIIKKVGKNKKFVPLWAASAQGSGQAGEPQSEKAEGSENSEDLVISEKSEMPEKPEDQKVSETESSENQLKELEAASAASDAGSSEPKADSAQESSVEPKEVSENA